MNYEVEISYLYKFYDTHYVEANSLEEAMSIANTEAKGVPLGYFGYNEKRTLPRCVDVESVSLEEDDE